MNVVMHLSLVCHCGDLQSIIHPWLSSVEVVSREPWGESQGTEAVLLLPWGKSQGTRPFWQNYFVVAGQLLSGC